jgi:hypothetical protein
VERELKINLDEIVDKEARRHLKQFLLFELTYAVLPSLKTIHANYLENLKFRIPIFQYKNVDEVKQCLGVVLHC